MYLRQLGTTCTSRIHELLNRSWDLTRDLHERYMKLTRSYSRNRITQSANNIFTPIMPATPCGADVTRVKKRGGDNNGVNSRRHLRSKNPTVGRWCDIQVLVHLNELEKCQEERMFSLEQTMLIEDAVNLLRPCFFQRAFCLWNLMKVKAASLHDCKIRR